MAERVGYGFSMVGSVWYSRRHPSRWAGATTQARLTVDDVTLVIEPLRLFRLFRFPAIRIPLASISRADRLPLGALRFAVPSAPELDGTRFYGLVPGDDRLTTLAQELAQRGLTGEIVPLATSWKEGLGNRAVLLRPGLIWRDHGWRGYVESVALFAIMVGIAYWAGGPGSFLSWIEVGVTAVLGAVWGITGHRLRNR